MIMADRDDTDYARAFSLNCRICLSHLPGDTVDGGQASYPVQQAARPAGPGRCHDRPFL